MPPKDILQTGPGGFPNHQALASAVLEASPTITAYSRTGDSVSVLIFRLGEEWLAFRTQTVAEVTLPRPVHRIPHRSNSILVGIVNLQGQVQLCVSLHSLLSVPTASTPSWLVVLRDTDQAENWVFAADLRCGCSARTSYAMAQRSLDTDQPGRGLQ